MRIDKNVLQELARHLDSNPLTKGFGPWHYGSKKVFAQSSDLLITARAGTFIVSTISVQNKGKFAIQAVQSALDKWRHSRGKA